jgi:hypothetical protein
MDVAVDEPGQERRAGEVDAPAARQLPVLLAVDAPVLHHDGAATRGLGAGAVDQEPAGEDRRLARFSHWLTP